MVNVGETAVSKYYDTLGFLILNKERIGVFETLLDSVLGSIYYLNPHTPCLFVSVFFGWIEILDMSNLYSS